MMNASNRCRLQEKKDLTKSILLSLLVAALSIQPLIGQSTAPPEVLTNDKIIQMVRARLGAGVIVDQIRSSPGKYSLNSSSLIELKRQGVPDEVISAMQAKRDGGAGAKETVMPTQTAGAKAKRGLSCKTPGVWELEAGSSAYTCFRTEAGSQQPGELQVTAEGTPVALDFQIVYISDEKPGIGLKQEWYGGPPVILINPGLITQATQMLRHQKQWVEMALGIDGYWTKVTSENDYVNYAHLRFLLGSNPARSLSGVADVLTAGLSNNSLDKVLKARLISLELTTENGVKHTLEIKPQEPSFQKFASRCNFLGYEPTIHERSGDGFNLLQSIPLKDRNWHGTAEEFAVQFPGFMNRMAAASGLPDRKYEKEIAFIIEAVRTCSTVVPGGDENVGKLGARYEVCGQGNGATNVSQQVGTSGAGSRAIELAISGRGSIKAEVFFDRLKGDPLLHGLSYPAPSDYRIISALINAQDLSGVRAAAPAQEVQRAPEISAQAPSPSGVDGFTPLGAAIPATDRQYTGTVQGFAAALQGFVRRAGTASSLPLHNYDNEIAFIIEAVRSCAELPPGTPQATSQLCRGGYRAVPRVGAAEGERTLVFAINVKKSPLEVDVLFKGLRGDPGPKVKPKSAAESAVEIADAYGIVSAHIFN